MSAAILPFRRAAPAPLPALPSLANFEKRYLPLLHAAIDVLEKDEATLRLRTRQMIEAGAHQLLVDVDDVMREAAADLTLLADACRMASDRLSDMIADVAPS